MNSNKLKNNQLKIISLIFFVCFSLYNLNGQNTKDIVIGKIESIDSKILNEQRKVWVYTPDELSLAPYE